MILNYFSPKNCFITAVIIFLCYSFLYFPQLYGKNFVDLDESYFAFNSSNLHTVNLNTVWMGVSTDYPIQLNQLEIIEGDGLITNQSIKNSERTFKLNADTDVRLVDYTFYYPGWTVTANGQPVVIEFQDPNYRGVITYRLPKGSYDVEVAFKETRLRSFSIVVSLFSIAGLWLWVVFQKRFFKRFLEK